MRGVFGGRKTICTAGCVKLIPIGCQGVLSMRKKALNIRFSDTK
jgi:hypothetical protein